MGVALEIITGFVANVSTLTSVTMNGSDTLTVRYSDPNKKIWLLNAGMLTETSAGIMEIRSPKLHDNVHGLRFRVPAAWGDGLIAWEYPQRLYPQDTLAWQLAGTNGAGAIQPGWLFLYYEDLQGIAARLIDSKKMQSRMVEVFTQETVLTGAVTGAYSASVALNANFDLMKPNTDYALMGYLVDKNCSSVHLRGADSGNLRLGGPGLAAQPRLTETWFVNLSELYEIPMIPVFNSAAKQGISADCVTDHNGGTFNVTWIFAELAPGS